MINNREDKELSLKKKLPTEQLLHVTSFLNEKEKSAFFVSMGKTQEQELEKEKKSLELKSIIIRNCADMKIIVADGRTHNSPPLSSEVVSGEKKVSREVKQINARLVCVFNDWKRPSSSSKTGIDFIDLLAYATIYSSRCIYTKSAAHSLARTFFECLGKQSLRQKFRENYMKLGDILYDVCSYHLTEYPQDYAIVSKLTRYHKDSIQKWHGARNFFSEIMGDELIGKSINDEIQNLIKKIDNECVKPAIENLRFEEHYKKRLIGA